MKAVGIRFSGFELTDSGELIRGGLRVDLQPQALKVLGLLASRPGEVVSRKEIRQHVWGSDTHVDFDQGINWCINRIREVLGDDAAAPQFIETVPRQGYRMLAVPVSVPIARSRWRTTGFSIAGVLLAGVAGFATHPWSRDRGVTVLVIPFDNLGPDGHSQTVEDVATEEMIATLGATDVSRLHVIDPLTAMKFKRSEECIRELGRRVDAQFVMVGAVRGVGPELRTTAQIFRVADNRQVWVGQEQRPLAGDPGEGAVRLGREAAQRLLDPAIP